MIVLQENHSRDNELAFEAMNTNFFLSVSNSSISNWKEQIIHWFKYVDREWSRFQEENELSKLNNLIIGQRISITPPLFDVLQKAEDYRNKTGGLFSPYLKDLLQYHGYDRSFPFEAAELERGTKTLLVKSSSFVFHPNDFSVTRVAEGQVDLGGIGKGYAVEWAMGWLKRFANVKYGIVDGGGDISVWSNGDKEWKIGISDPFHHNKEIKQITLKNGSIATSNIIYRSWRQGDQKKHHILNGKTGVPVESEIIQATVITSNCLDAEVGAKLCFMETGAALEQQLTKLNLNYKYVLVNRNGDVIIS